MDKLKFGQAVLALGFSILLPLTANADRQGVELGLGIAHFSFGDNIGLEDDVGWKANLGYRFNGPIGIEINRAEVGAELTVIPREVDVSHTFFDALYHFNSGGNIEPYIALGFGEAEADLGPVTVDDTTIDAGVGIKFYLSDNAILRPDIHYADVDEFGDDHIMTSLTFAYLFGGSSSRKAPVTPKPIAAPPIADADNDGVPDTSDACASTPADVSVDVSGCPLDSDSDGVYDYMDNCEDTAQKLKVDANGCPMALTETVSIDLEVNFDSNSDIVKAEYLPEIRRVADFLEQYENTVAVIEGHTDTSGSAQYNKTLSQKRADAVARVLVEQLGVETGKVTAIGYGEEQPIADESTREGMLANRRVVAKISTQVESLQEKE